MNANIDSRKPHLTRNTNASVYTKVINVLKTNHKRISYMMNDSDIVLG